MLMFAKQIRIQRLYRALRWSRQSRTSEAFSTELKENVLAPYIASERRSRIDRVLKERTRTVVVVLEQLHSRGNQNAVYRTMDALGFQEVHSVLANCNEDSQPQQASGDPRTDAGARKWLSIDTWHTTRDCLLHLKARGYRIVATAVEDARMISHPLPVWEVDFLDKVAVVFGGEKEGVSDLALEMSDVCCFIPMFGFTPSFNVSVAAALVLYEARMQRMRKLGQHGDLTEDEVRDLRAEFYVRTLTKSKAARMLHKVRSVNGMDSKEGV